MFLGWSMARGSGAALRCSITVRKGSTLRLRLRCRLAALGGSGPAGESGGFCPLALKVARVRSNASGKGVQDCDPLLALFSVRSPHAQCRDFPILATFSCINPPDG